MMEFAGHSERFEDLLKEEDGWYTRFTITTEESVKFKDWFIQEVQDLGLAYSEEGAEKNFAWFNLAYGLRILDPEKS